jgi:hypothetical protein
LEHFMHAKTLFTSLVVSLALAFPAIHAQATDINFDNGPADTSVGSFYSGLTFSGAAFTDNFGSFGTSGGLGIMSSSSFYNWDSSAPITVTFATAVANFSIGVADLGNNGFTLQAFDANNVLLGTTTQFGTDEGSDNYQVLSAAFGYMTTIRMFQASNANPDSILLDNMTYTTVTSVPEPGTYVLMALGLAGIGTISRRRKN